MQKASEGGFLWLLGESGGMACDHCRMDKVIQTDVQPSSTPTGDRSPPLCLKLGKREKVPPRVFRNTTRMCVSTGARPHRLEAVRWRVLNQGGDRLDAPLSLARRRPCFILAAALCSPSAGLSLHFHWLPPPPAPTADQGGVIPPHLAGQKVRH